MINEEPKEGKQMRIREMYRQSGKTTVLMDWLEVDSDRVVVVHSAQERHRLARDYPHLENQIFTIDAVVKDHKLRGRDYRKLRISIDNLDLILPQLLGGPVDIVMVNKEQYERY